MKSKEKICMGCKDPISRFIQLAKDPNNCCQKCRRFKSALDESAQLIEKKLKKNLRYKHPNPRKKLQEYAPKPGRNSTIMLSKYIIMVTERICNYFSNDRNKQIRGEIDFFSRVRNCAREIEHKEKEKIIEELKDLENLDLYGEAAMDKISISDIPDVVKDLINQYTMYVRINFKKWCGKEELLNLI